MIDRIEENKEQEKILKYINSTDVEIRRLGVILILNNGEEWKGVWRCEKTYYSNNNIIFTNRLYRRGHYYVFFIAGSMHCNTMEELKSKFKMEIYPITEI